MFKAINITIRIVHCSQRIGAKNPMADIRKNSPMVPFPLGDQPLNYLSVPKVPLRTADSPMAMDICMIGYD